MSSYYDLDHDRRKTVIHTGPNSCAQCGQSINGEHIAALNKHWHTDHFCCMKCNRPIKTTDFYEYNGGGACKSCMENSYRCSQCSQSITGKYFMSEDRKYYHTHCLPRQHCARCGNVTNEVVATAMGKHYHPECFTCTGCGRKLDKEFTHKDNNPYCQSCEGSVSHGSSSSHPSVVCARCDQGITGKYVTYDSHPYHPHCFRCENCNNSMDVSGFYIKNGKKVCPNCK